MRDDDIYTPNTLQFCLADSHSDGDGWRADDCEAPSNLAEVSGPVAWLPHSCDEWKIGGVASAKCLVADLQAFIAKAEKVTL